MNEYNLNKFISYAIQNGNNPNVELECRFGTYNKITSSIKPHSFFNIYNLFKSRPKSYSFIKDVLYDGGRQRTILSDSKNFTKDLFNNPDKIIDVIQDYVKKYSQDTTKSFHLSKKKVYKPIQYENVKLDLVIEDPNVPDPNKTKTYIKNKFRCSLKGIWDIDLTILLIIDCKTRRPGLYFEIESEFNYKCYISKKADQDQTLNEFREISNAIITTIECHKSSKTPLNVELRYSLFNQVVTLERQFLDKLIHGNYSVTEKADGERVFIYIDSKKNIYRLNPTNIIPDKVPLTKSAKSLKIIDTLIDGEILSINGKLVFLGFDTLYFNGKDYRNFNLEERLKCLKTTTGELNKVKLGFEFRNKVFYMKDVFTNAHKIWTNREKMFKYNLDGLIFTPIYGSYQGNLPNYKWKDKHSIDIRLMYNTKFNFTEFHPHAIPYTRKGQTEVANAYTDHQTGNIYYTRRININNYPNSQKYKHLGLVSGRGDLGVSGKLKGTENLKNMVDIVEIEWNPSSKKWDFLRTRPDKERPNASKSVISVLDAIVDDITISEIAKMKHKPSLYDNTITESKSCYADIGFNFISADISSNICSFYTWAYESIMNKGSTIVALGCDICVLKAISKKYTNILVIEPNCLEVYGEEKSEGYSGLKEMSRVLGLNACIVWGSTDISNGLKAFTKSGQSEIDSFMKKKIIDLVFINSFVDMFYQNGKISKDIFNKSISVLKSLTKNIIGVYLNGTQIIKYLERQECLLTKNKELHPLYKIYLNHKNFSKYNCPDIFKIKSGVNLVEIQRMQNSFMGQFQPLIFDKNIQDIIKDSGLKIQECKSLKSLYSEYKRNGGTMNEYDCIIADITKYFKIT